MGKGYAMTVTRMGDAAKDSKVIDLSNPVRRTKGGPQAAFGREKMKLATYFLAAFFFVP